MPDLRIAAGVLTQTALLAASTSVVKNWPNGDARARWEMAYAMRIVTNEAVVEEALNGQLVELGGLNFTWTLPLLNEAMWHYLKDTKFSGRRRQQVTVYQRNRFVDSDVADQWVAIVAWAELPRFTIEDVNPRGDKWYSPVVIKFFDGHYAAIS
jgi:hypothetical protein